MHAIIKALTPMLITCVLAGLVLGILAPLGTSACAPVWRFSYWIGLCLAGGIGAGAVEVFTQRRGIKLGVWVCALYQSIASTLAVSSVILMLTLRTYGMPSALQILQIMLYVWVISMTISSIGALLRASKNSQDAAPTRAALYERLKPKLRSADIYALAAEDHYVRVITSGGDDLILMRLSDAIRETAPLKGLSPHRSWWVAEGGAQKVGKSEIALHSGQTVPISRSGMKLVRAAGWV